MIKKLFLIGFLITFLFLTLSLFLPILYVRYEIRNYLGRLAEEALIQTDSEIKKNVQSFLGSISPEVQFIELQIVRTKKLEFSIKYQQLACLEFNKEKICLFPVRSILNHKYNPNV